MLTRRFLALGSATVALALVPGSAALAAGTSVIVRVEGRTHTLLAATTVHTHTGSITMGGTPTGACPATTAAGALQQATHGRWGGIYSSSLGGIELISIFGERYPFTSSSFWGIWADNKFASFGICGLKLHRGEQILFAPAPDRGTVYPTAITAPKTVKAKRSFKVKVVYYNSAGKAKPLAKAKVHVGSTSAVTDRHGLVSVNATTAGKLKITATEKGYIRPATVTVKVS
jgi:hypothetical protein